MQFVDYLRIRVKAGDGGRGCVSFRREKCVPRGGPDGGDGGRGGHVIIRAASELNTLLDLRYHREYSAGRGGHGKGKNMHGRDGEDRVIPVPVGTTVKDEESGTVVADLDHDGAAYVVARGGRGGLGNAHFATSTRQAPRFALPGEDGEEKALTLELKLLADVGLVGLPNAGKSTLISVITAARPKIADYPFTTVVPNLGVVKGEGMRSFVIADIPGLIEGAHKGAGLGFRFLRHIERTSLILHLVDVSDGVQSDPVEDFEKINRELVLYNPMLAAKHMAVAGTKCDMAFEGTRVKRLHDHCRMKRMDFFAISAVTGTGVEDLVKYLTREVEARLGK
jgi:GTP-binding protein